MSASDGVRVSGTSPPLDAAGWVRLMHRVALEVQTATYLDEALHAVAAQVGLALSARESTVLEVLSSTAESAVVRPVGERGNQLDSPGRFSVHCRFSPLAQAVVRRTPCADSDDPAQGGGVVVVPVSRSVHAMAAIEWRGVPAMGAEAQSLLLDVLHTVQLHLSLLAEREAVRPSLLGDEARQLGLLNALVESLPMGVLMFEPTELRLLTLNVYAERTFMVRREDVRGKTVVGAFGKRISSLNEPAMRQAVRERVSIEEDFDVETRQGHRTFNVRHFPLHDDEGALRWLMVIARDVTKERAAERDLHESEARFREFAESIDDLLFVANPERTRFHFMSRDDNQGWRRSAGAGGDRGEPPMLQSLLDRIEPEDPDMRAARTAAEKRLEPTDIAYPVQHPQKGLRWLRARTRSRAMPDGEIRVYGLISDETEDRLRQIELRDARDAAESASRAKSQFMANMSHEIRTPMNGILGMTELLLGTPLSDRQRRSLMTVYRSGETLLEIINDILDFSKIEAGRLELSQIDFSPRGVIEDTLELLAPRAHEKGLELSLHELPGVPPVVKGDPLRLRQVLTNLVANGIKFTDRGEVVVTLGVEPGGEGPVLRFTVRDTGIGIEADMLPRLFSAFTQASVGMSRRYGGTGLGLSISRQLVELMGGHIEVESQLGQGSRFTFALPFAPSAVDAPVLESTLSMPGLKVLIADDNEANRTVLEDMLRAWGMQTTLAEDGQQALAILQGRSDGAYSRPFDLALIDMNMPRLDGLALARALRDAGSQPKMKMILLSSLSSPAEAREATEAGYSLFLPKPVRKAELRQAILGISSSTSGAPPLTAQLNAHILVIEDNPVNQEVIGQMLRAMGCRVQISGGGPAGLAALRETRFDLVLMDIQMPVMDGVEAMGRFRDRSGSGVSGFATPPETPVIAVTANALDGDEQRYRALGFDGYLSKPFRQNQLLAMLTHHLRPLASFEPGADTGGGPGPTPGSGTAVELDAQALERLRELDPTGENRLMERVVTAFDASVRRLLPQLDESLQTPDLPVIRHVSHTLKSSSASIGAVKLSKMCAEMESLARQGRADGMTERIQLLQAEVELVRVALKRMLDA